MTLDRYMRASLLALIAIALLYVGAVRPDQAYDPFVVESLAGLQAERIDAPALEFELVDLAGNPHRLSDFRGELVFLNFWASWCPPCREEMPSLVSLGQSYGGRGFSIVAVSLDDDPAQLMTFLAENQIPPESMLILQDPSGDLARMYGTELLPETYLIDRDGRLVARFQNAYDWESPQIASLLERMLRLPWRL